MNYIFNEMLVDVIAIAETKLDDNYLTAEYAKPGYKIYRRDRPVRGNYGGGIITYVNVNIPSIRKT